VAGLEHGAVATVHPIATDAAMTTLEQGGNAIDAAVSAMLTLGVVDGHNSGIGGGCFMLIRTSDGRVYALDGRERAPAAATRDMFIRDGEPDTTLSQTGPLASGVPGSLAVYDHAVRSLGRRSLAELIEPAARIAEAGFPIDRIYAAKLRSERDELMKFEASRAIVLNADGSPLEEGQTLVQADLARTYRAIAREGIEHFYRGAFARAVDAWMKANGGLLTFEDFADYRIALREPLVTRYRGHTVIGFPPPSSGGLHVAQILGMVERFELGSMNDVDRITTLANAMQLAFADRAHWLGDPDFARVPRGLVDPAYLNARGAMIATDRAMVVESHGTPGDLDPFGRKHTTHVSVADAWGNVVAVTATVNTAFGSKVVVPGTGVFLNNQMDDFSIQPGVPNHFGLIGAANNAVEPGKRPLSSMSPTIVEMSDGTLIVIGSAGGPRIITQVVNVLVNLIDRGTMPEQAMREPRMHHQWKPDSLWIERSFGPALLDQLSRRGFELNPVDPVGATNLVVVRHVDASAVGEPRLPGKAVAK
jgi:gamma-glutamyltranspeptidase/glutathione hydrolase